MSSVCTREREREREREKESSKISVFAGAQRMTQELACVASPPTAPNERNGKIKVLFSLPVTGAAKIRKALLVVVEVVEALAISN